MTLLHIKARRPLRAAPVRTVGGWDREVAHAGPRSKWSGHPAQVAILSERFEQERADAPCDPYHRRISCRARKPSGGRSHPRWRLRSRDLAAAILGHLPAQVEQ